MQDKNYEYAVATYTPEPEDNAHIAASIECYSTKKSHLVQDWFQHEITQTHCVVNGTWEDTIANMQVVCDKLAYSQITLDGMIHLGDMTDGMVSRQVT